MEPFTDHLPLKTINWEMHVSLIGKANAALMHNEVWVNT